MSRFINQFRYHAKRTFALIFIILAIAFQVANFTVGIINIASGSKASFNFIWNFIILMICYVRMLKGNVEDTTKACVGVLTFVYLSTISLVFDTIYSAIDIGLSSDRLQLIIQIVIFVLMAMETALGIATAVKLRRLIYGFGKTSLKQVKILAGFFFALLILGQAAYIGIWFLFVGDLSNVITVLLLLLSPISELFASIAAWITLSRIE